MNKVTYIAYCMFFLKVKAGRKYILCGCVTCEVKIHIELCIWIKLSKVVFWGAVKLENETKLLSCKLSIYLTDL